MGGLEGRGQVNFIDWLARERGRRWGAMPSGKGDFAVRKAGLCGTASVVFANAKYCVERM